MTDPTETELKAMRSLVDLLAGKASEFPDKIKHPDAFALYLNMVRAVTSVTESYQEAVAICENEHKGAVENECYEQGMGCIWCIQEIKVQMEK